LLTLPKQARTIWGDKESRSAPRIATGLSR
jgi:hypothetical protein